MFFPSHLFMHCHNSCSPWAYCRALRLSSVFKSTKFASTPHDPGFKPAHMAGNKILSVSLAAGTDFLMTIALLRDSLTLFSSRSHEMVCHAKSLSWRTQARAEHWLWGSDFMYTQKVNYIIFFLLFELMLNYPYKQK